MEMTGTKIMIRRILACQLCVELSNPHLLSLFFWFDPMQDVSLAEIQSTDAIEDTYDRSKNGYQLMKGNGCAWEDRCEACLYQHCFHCVDWMHLLSTDGEEQVFSASRKALAMSNSKVLLFPMPFCASGGRKDIFKQIARRCYN